MAFRPYTLDEILDAESVVPEIWLDAKDETTITEVSGAVSAWVDKSENAYGFQQSSAGARPELIGGNDGIRFGTNDYLFITQTPLYAMGSLNMFIVGDLAGSSNDALIAEANSGNALPIYQLGLQNSGADARMFLRSSGNSISIETINSGTIYEDWTEGATSVLFFEDTGTTISAGKDGVIGTAQNYTRSGVVTMNRLAINALIRTSVSTGSSGDYKEIIVTPPLTTGQREQVEG